MHLLSCIHLINIYLVPDCVHALSEGNQQYISESDTISVLGELKAQWRDFKNEQLHQSMIKTVHPRMMELMDIVPARRLITRVRTPWRWHLG